jgi:uncharacterized membrane protein YhhN
MNTKKIISLYVISSFLFIISLKWHPYAGSFLLKSIPALAMSFILFNERALVLRPMSLGFIFSAMGDIALDLDRQKYFVLGLIFFLLAHLLYSATFIKLSSKKNLSFLKISFVLCFAGIMAYFLWPNLGGMKIPVMIYLMVICGMTISSSTYLARGNLALIGALIFMSSDAMIAISKFLTPFPYSSLAIITTYYLGNFLIGYSVIKQEITKG